MGIHSTPPYGIDGVEVIWAADLLETRRALGPAYNRLFEARCCTRYPVLLGAAGRCGACGTQPQVVGLWRDAEPAQSLQEPGA